VPSQLDVPKNLENGVSQKGRAGSHIILANSWDGTSCLDDCLTEAPNPGPKAGSCLEESLEMDLAALVKKYLEIAGGFGRSVHLSQFGLSKTETEKLIAALDEDYQISRYMVLSRERDEALAPYLSGARVYLINGYEVTHVSFDADVQKLL
jgi:hypothetical protein